MPSDRAPLLLAVLLAGPALGGCASVRDTVAPRGGWVDRLLPAEPAESAERVLPVLDLHHRRIGEVEDLAIDPLSGEVAGAVVVHNGSPPSLVPRQDWAWDPLRRRIVLRSTLEEHAARDLPRPQPDGRPWILFEDPAAPAPEDPFRASEPKTIEGVITALEVTPDGIGYLKLREDNNHLHRILLAPDYVLEDASLPLEEERRVRVEGVETRDEKGLLRIATQLAAGDRQLRLRNEAGEPLWSPREASAPRPGERRLLSRAGFEGTHVLCEDGSLRGHVVHLDADHERVLYLSVLLAGEQEPRVLPWVAFRFEPGGALRLPFSEERLREAPLLKDASPGEEFLAELAAAFAPVPATAAASTAPGG